MAVAPDWGALWDYTELMQQDPLAVYGDLLPLFRASDLNLVNVECALGEKGAPIKKGGPNLRGADGTVRELKEVSALLAEPVAVGQVWDAFVDGVGQKGMEATVRVMMGQFEDDSDGAAARLHNLFFCPAHRTIHLYNIMFPATSQRRKKSPVGGFFIAGAKIGYTLIPGN